MNETVEIDLREIFAAFVKKAWLIFLCAAILGAAMLFYTANFVSPTYKATTTLYVNNKSNEESNTVSSTDLAVALRLVNSYVDIIKREVVTSKVVEKLQMNISPAQLSSMISAQVVGETEIFTVTVTTSNPELSAMIANTIADEAPDIISGIISGSRATVIDYARVPSGRASPNYATSALLGVAIGAILAMVCIFIQTRLDVHVKNEEMLAAICGAPVMGVIPDFADATGEPRKVRRKRK